MRGKAYFLFDKIKNLSSWNMLRIIGDWRHFQIVSRVMRNLRLILKHFWFLWWKRQHWCPRLYIKSCIIDSSNQQVFKSWIVGSNKKILSVVKYYRYSLYHISYTIKYMIWYILYLTNSFHWLIFISQQREKL